MSNTQTNDIFFYQVSIICCLLVIGYPIYSYYDIREGECEFIETAIFYSNHVCGHVNASWYKYNYGPVPPISYSCLSASGKYKLRNLTHYNKREEPPTENTVRQSQILHLYRPYQKFQCYYSNAYLKPNVRRTTPAHEFYYQVEAMLRFLLISGFSNWIVYMFVTCQCEKIIDGCRK